ncbi:MAG: prepilin-type N-terminal cleavage/methylation domain-containing protein [Chitinispirillaceae bacterium]|nr:prepilin-type N-terminal cleavage/methylation domain-containing protein [Chitinispirillaceae bacterium]
MGRKQSERHAGFSLVEAIVVAVILGIMAAVAIPLYNGYLKDSRQRAVDELAQSAAAAADGYCRKTTAAPTDVADLNLFYDSSKFTIEIDSPDVIVRMTGYTETEKKVRFK